MGSGLFGGFETVFGAFPRKERCGRFLTKVATSSREFGTILGERCLAAAAVCGGFAGTLSALGVFLHWGLDTFFGNRSRKDAVRCSSFLTLGLVEGTGRGVFTAAQAAVGDGS